MHSHPSPSRAAAHQPGLVAQPAGPQHVAPALARAQPAGRDFDYESAFAGSTSRRSRRTSSRAERLAGLVAGRLRPLRPPHDPAELARGRHLPHRGRPRRRRRRQPAVRAAEPLARQRQPRQGPPAALAGQEEARRRRSPGPTCWSSPGTSPWSTMGFETFGFGFGREDIWEPDETLLGPRGPTGSATSATAAIATCENPLGAVQMGLIYVNPEGPNGEPDPLAAAHDIRETFRRMAMNDEETVALIAGGHSFGKTHGAASPTTTSDAEPEGCPVIGQGLGWQNTFGSGKGADAITTASRSPGPARPRSGATASSTTCSATSGSSTQSPAGAHQWAAKDAEATIPDPHGRLAERGSRPCSPPTSRCAWTRTTRRSRAGSTRTLDEFPAPSPRPGTSCSTATWARSTATSVPRSPSSSCGRTRSRPSTAARLRRATSPPSRQQAPRLRSQRRPARPDGVGLGVHVPRHRQARRRQRRPDPARAAEAAGRSTTPTSSPACSRTLEQIRSEFNGAGGAQVSLADLIVLAGSAAVEKAAKAAGHDVTVPFTPGRTDATQEQTDVESFAVLEPTGRRLPQLPRGPPRSCRRETLLLDKANLLRLSRPGDDGAGGRPARARRQRRAARSTACSPTARARSRTTSS